MTTVKKIGIAAASLLLVAAVALPSYSVLGQGGVKSDLIELPGVSGTFNNLVFAFDRYGLIAPHMPTVASDDEYELSELDNHFLYVFDVKKPNIIHSVDLRPLYFPTNVVFDPVSQNVFVRGTVFKVNEADGMTEAHEAIAHLHVSLGIDDKPLFDPTVVTVGIKGVHSELSADAPFDLEIGHGNLLVFSNGASVFTYNLTEGYLYQVDLIPPSRYGADHAISGLQLDQATNTLVIHVAKNTRNERDDLVLSSELHFYRLEPNGAVTKITELLSDKFGAGAFVPGSNVEITTEATEGAASNPLNAYFITSDGSLCQVNLQGKEPSLSGEIKVLKTIPGFVQLDPESVTPRLLKYDASTRVLAAVTQGFSLNIRRPFNERPGRPGRIRRPFNLRIATELASAVLIKFNKKGKVIGSTLFEDGFDEEGGLSNFVFGGGSLGFISTYSGKLFSVDFSRSEQVSLQPLGEIGARVEEIAYHTDRSSIVAINSFELESEEGQSPESASGGLSIIKLRENDSRSVLQMLVPAAPAVFRAPPSIRRPYNLKR